MQFCTVGHGVVSQNKINIGAISFAGPQTAKHPSSKFQVLVIIYMHMLGSIYKYIYLLIRYGESLENDQVITRYRYV